MIMIYDHYAGGLLAELFEKAMERGERVQRSGDCRIPYKLSFISCCHPCQRATLHRIQRPQDYKNPNTTASHPKNNIHIHSGFYVLSSPVPV